MGITYLDDTPQGKITYLEQPKQTSETIPQMLGRNLVEAGQKTYKEGISPILSGLSTAAFGLPKAAATQAGVKEQVFPEQETVGGKILRGVSETAGFMGGGAVKTGAKVAEKIGGNLLRNKIARGATEFGIAGALQTPEEDMIAPGQRATQAVIGAFLGGAVPAAKAAIPKIVEATKDGFQTLKGLKLPTTATLEKEQFGLKVAKKARLQTLQESTQQARYNLNQIKDTTKQVFDNNYKVLQGKLKDASEQGVLNFQKSLPDFYRSVGDSYGTALDTVSQNLELTRGKLNIQEVNNILRKSIEESTNESLNYGKAFNKLNELWSGKYAMSTSNQAKTFSLQEVKADIDQVFKLAKYGVRGTGEDIPAHILRRNWGEFATSNVEGYADLQAKYAQVVDAMKLSDKLFKPKAGELYAEKGASFLRKFGMAEKPPVAQEKLMSMLEQGTDLGQGVGNLSAPVKQIGAELRAAKEANQLLKTNISERLDKLNLTSAQVRRSITKEFDARIDDYTSKLMDRKKAVALARMLGLGVAAGVGAYGVGRGIANIAGFRESYGQ